MTIIHIALAVLLFYLVNWIGKYSSAFGYLQLSLFVRADQAPAFNFILKSFAPTVFIIIIATTFYALNLTNVLPQIWLVSAYYFAFRILYNLGLGRALLLNWLSLSIQGLGGIGTSYLVYRYLILPRRPLFPDPSEIGNQLWIIIALFLYATFNSVRTSSEGSTRRKNNYLRARFRSARNQYADLIENQFPKRYMELVAYAILILESFNRPRVAQVIERAVFPWGSHTIGPMQVWSDKRLSDRDSVQLGVHLLKGHFQKTREELSGKPVSQYELIRLALAKYNRDENYIREIFELLHILWAQVAPEFRTEFEQMYRNVA